LVIFLLSNFHEDKNFNEVTEKCPEK